MEHFYARFSHATQLENGAGKEGGTLKKVDFKCGFVRIQDVYLDKLNLIRCKGC